MTPAAEVRRGSALKYSTRSHQSDGYSVGVLRATKGHSLIHTCIFVIPANAGIQSPAELAARPGLLPAGVTFLRGHDALRNIAVKVVSIAAIAR